MGLSAESKEVKKWFHETAEKKWKLLLPYMKSMDFDVFRVFDSCIEVNVSQTA